jgi:hypothetical protein
MVGGTCDCYSWHSPESEEGAHNDQFQIGLDGGVIMNAIQKVNIPLTRLFRFARSRRHLLGRLPRISPQREYSQASKQRDDRGIDSVPYKSLF